MRGGGQLWCGAGGLLTNVEYRATIDGCDYLQLVIRACALIAFRVGFSTLGRGQKVYH